MNRELRVDVLLEFGGVALKPGKRRGEAFGRFDQQLTRLFVLDLDRACYFLLEGVEAFVNGIQTLVNLRETRVNLRETLVDFIEARVG